MNERIYRASIFICTVVTDLAFIYGCRVIAYQKTLLREEDEFVNLYVPSVSRSYGFYKDDNFCPILAPPSLLSSASPNKEKGG